MGAEIRHVERGEEEGPNFAFDPSLLFPQKPPCAQHLINTIYKPGGGEGRP